MLRCVLQSAALSACLSTKESLDNGRREMKEGEGRSARASHWHFSFDAIAERSYSKIKALMRSNQISNDS